MKRAALLVFLALLAAGCDRYPTVEDGDYLSIAVVCPDGRAQCPPIANGASILGVEACTRAKDRKSGLKVVLRISPLEFQNPPDLNQKSVYTASLTGNPCVTATFVTRTSPDLIRIDAEMGDYRTDPIWLQAQAADIATIELLPQPAVLTVGSTSTIKLNAMVLTTNGRVTNGTRVFFNAIATPPTGSAYVWPGSAIVDLTKTPPTAEATLVTGPSVTSVQVELTAVPPPVEGLPDIAPLTRTFTMAGSQ